MIARQADTPERRGRGGPVGRAIPVDHPGTRVGPELVVELGASADQRRRQTEGGVVRFGNRRLETVDAHDLKQRAEQLDIGAFGHGGHVDDSGGQERAVGHRTGHVPDHLAPVRHQDQEAFRQAVGRLVVYHRTHIGRGVGVRMVDDQAVGEFADLFDQIFGHRLLDDQPPRVGATLPRAQESRLHDKGRRGPDVGGIPHDDGIVSAHFERQYLVGPRGELAVERDARPCRPGKQQSVDPLMPGERLADVRAARDQPQHLFGHAGAVEQFDQPCADRRGLFGRFEQHRIARDQRGHDMPVGQVGGEIIGAENREGAMGFVTHRVAQAHRALDAPVGCALGIGFHRNIDLVANRFDFGARFPKRLSRLARDQVGKVFGVGLYPIDEAAQRFGAEGDRLCRPLRPRPARDLYFGVDVADGMTPQFGAGRRFVGNQLLAHRRATRLKKRLPAGRVRASDANWTMASLLSVKPGRGNYRGTSTDRLHRGCGLAIDAATGL